MKNTVLFALIIILFSSCMQKGYVLYNKKPDEIVTSRELKLFMTNNPNPTIVVRAPNSSDKITEQDKNGQLYNIIEKELLKAGFNIKDRTMFNQVIKNKETLSYQDIYDLTKTDLILELISIDGHVQYDTNIYYNKNSDAIVSDKNVKRNGASIKFKILNLKENRLLGSYDFNYTPCTTNNDDCQCAIGYKLEILYPYTNYCVSSRYSPYQGVEQEVLNSIMTYGINLFINEIKQ